MLLFKENDILRLKKEHPCGNTKWKVLKNGVDVKMECLGCNRIVKIDRKELRRRIIEIVEEGVGNEKG